MCKKNICVFICYLIAVVNLSAQSFLAPIEYNPRTLRWDELRKEQLLCRDFDFACLYVPGIGKPDYGYSYSQKTGQLVLVECLSHLGWIGAKLNPDGTTQLDVDGNPVWEDKLLKVRKRQYKLKLPDSLAIPLIELYRLAVQTAYKDTCESDSPPIYDGWTWEFFAGDLKGGATFESRYTCPMDSSDNFRTFKNIHFAIERAIKAKDVHLIEKKLPEIKGLLVEWRLANARRNTKN